MRCTQCHAVRNGRHAWIIRGDRRYCSAACYRRGENVPEFHPDQLKGGHHATAYRRAPRSVARFEHG